MTELGPVSAHLESELRELARQHGIVVWLDKAGLYSTFADGLKVRADAGSFPFPVRCFRGSFLALMRELDGLEDGVGQTPLVLHAPGMNEDEIAKTPLFEFYRAGRRERFGLPKLVREAAYGRCTVEQLDALLADEALTIERADTYLRQVAAGAPAAGPDLSALSAEALVDALAPGGTLEPQAARADVQRAVCERAEVLLGFVAREGRTDEEGDRRPVEAADAASNLLLDLVGHALQVEFVHDLKRAPRMAALAPLARLRGPIVEACRRLAKHLRARHAERYARWADETELRLQEELSEISASDLGQIDTFRIEDQKVLAAALEALSEADYEVAHRWALARGADKSFWTRRDRQRYLGWQLVEHAAALGLAAREHAALLHGASNHAEAVERYATKGYLVDAAHRRMEQAREQASVLEIEEYPALRQNLDELRRVYRTWADAQAVAFNALCRAQGFLPPASLQQRTLFEEIVRPAAQQPGTTAYFMVDALRFELAQELTAVLSKVRSASVSLKARLAELPTVTEVGMNVLAPLAHNGKLRPEISDKGVIRGFRGGQARVATPEDRQKAIHERIGGKSCPKLSLEEVLARDLTSLRKTVAEAKVVIVHCEGIDKAGEKGVGLLVFEQELRKLAAAWRQLLQAGVLRCVITADHGFLLHDATTRDPLPHGFKTDPKRRHVVSFEHLERPNEVAVGATDLDYELEPTVWFLSPESAAPFNLGERAKDFVHGGNSLQERVIPVLIVQHKHAIGTAVVRYRIEARESLRPMLAARPHRISLVVVAQGQTGLAFGTEKEIELALECDDEGDREHVHVQLVDASGARITGNLLVATVEREFEVFFRLIGPREQRVRVRARHATDSVEVDAYATVERFEVEQLVVPGSAAEQERVPAYSAQGHDSWLQALPAGGVRDVFRHLAIHGSVNEAEATSMLGGGRQFRSFSRHFEAYAKLAPFGVQVQTVSGSKCYVRGER